MKIAYYTDQLYLHGGIEKILSQKLNYLADKVNEDVFLITSEQKEKSFCYTVSNKVNHFDLEVNYDRTKSYFSFKNLIKVPRHIYQLKKILNKIKPDVLIVCNYGIDFFFIPFVGRKIKTIKEYHSSRYFYPIQLNKESFFKKLKRNFLERIEEKYSYIVVLNEDEKQHYKSRNVKVIPNFVTISDFQPNKRSKIIIAAGRIAPVKQFDHLIKAWSLIEKNYKEWEVHIYGEGEDEWKNKLIELKNTLGVKRLFFKGVIPDMTQKMREASIFAMTSKTECFPMVLLESMSNGLPIISYDCPYGPRNILTQLEDGTLIDLDNINKFSSELSYMIVNEEERIKMECNSKNNVKRFEEGRVFRKWIDLFNSK